MGLRLIRNLIAYPWRENEFSTVRELRLHLTVQTKQDVALFAPMIGQIIWRVLNHSHANIAKLPRTPESCSGFSVMNGRFDRQPVGESKGDIRYAHSWKAIAL